ncbi:hypothetical protein BaRGS_00010099 [Batillaria attramentaria]|uniref:SprT-like domain-containing protein n=1 Tax=Batillaria attramentaria TaxID=370345 RepID=A0ABD0LGS4_9CAEN
MANHSHKTSSRVKKILQDFANISDSDDDGQTQQKQTAEHRNSDIADNKKSPADCIPLTKQSTQKLTSSTKKSLECTAEGGKAKRPSSRTASKKDTHKKVFKQKPNAVISHPQAKENHPEKQRVRHVPKTKRSTLHNKTLAVLGINFNLSDNSDEDSTDTKLQATDCHQKKVQQKDSQSTDLLNAHDGIGQTDAAERDKAILPFTVATPAPDNSAGTSRDLDTCISKYDDGLASKLSSLSVNGDVKTAGGFTEKVGPCTDEAVQTSFREKRYSSSGVDVATSCLISDVLQYTDEVTQTSATDDKPDVQNLATSNSAASRHTDDLHSQRQNDPTPSDQDARTEDVLNNNYDAVELNGKHASETQNVPSVAAPQLMTENTEQSGFRRVTGESDEVNSLYRTGSETLELESPVQDTECTAQKEFESNCGKLSAASSPNEIFSPVLFQGPDAPSNQNISVVRDAGHAVSQSLLSDGTLGDESALSVPISESTRLDCPPSSVSFPTQPDTNLDSSHFMSCLNAGTGAPGLIKGSSEQIHAPFQQLKKVKKEDDDKLLTGVPLKQLKTVKQERVDGDDFHFQREKRMDFWGLAVKEEYPDKSPVNSPFQQLKTVKKEHADSDDSPAKLHMDFFRPVLKEESPVKDPFRQLKAVKQENHDGKGADSQGRKYLDSSGPLLKEQTFHKSPVDSFVSADSSLVSTLNLNPPESSVHMIQTNDSPDDTPGRQFESQPEEEEESKSQYTSCLSTPEASQSFYEAADVSTQTSPVQPQEQEPSAHELDPVTHPETSAHEPEPDEPESESSAHAPEPSTHEPEPKPLEAVASERNRRRLPSDSSSDGDDDAKLEAFFQTMRTPAKGTGREEDSDRDLADFIVDDSDVTESDEDVCYPDLSRRLNFADLPSRKSRLPASQRKGNRKPRDPVFIGSSESSEESDNDTDDSEREEDNVFNNQLKWYTPATSMKTKPRRGISVGDCTPSARDFPSAGQQSKNQQLPSWTTPSLAAKRSTCTGNATVTHFSFLRSLSADMPDHRRDPEARRFISQFRQRREEISSRLFKLFNTTIFDNQLPVDMGIVWNKRLLKTAGRCKEKRIGDRREAAIELSVKVCDSAERARDTLVHEMCHAAVWLISGVKEGHGPHWKYWARKANKVHPEIPIIQRCHDYTISTKYIYRCTKCGYQIGRHSKSLDTDRKICGRCRGQFQLLLASAGGAASDGSACPTPRTPRTPNPFAMFVKENYGSVKKQGLSHKEVMNQLSKDFAEKNKI